MPVIKARAIEFVQQMYAGQPGLYPPRGIEDLEHEISHILDLLQKSVLGDYDMGFDAFWVCLGLRSRL